MSKPLSELKEYKPGDNVVVVGRLKASQTTVGLFGFVESVSEKEVVSVVLLKYRTYDPVFATENQENAGIFQVIQAHGEHSDFKMLEGPVGIARVENMKRHFAQTPETPSTIRDIIKHLIGIRMRDEDEVDVGQCYTLSNSVTRYEKNYPSYYQEEARKISEDVRRWASCDTVTPTERAKWKQALVILDKCSFWSDKPECRDVVQELDLDPFKDGFNTALYETKTVYAPNGSLRTFVIRLWNDGAEILRIEDMEDETTCWGYDKRGEPNGFLVTVGSRRYLPVG